jgi:hypothetical protein
MHSYATPVAVLGLRCETGAARAATWVAVLVRISLSDLGELNWP